MKHQQMPLQILQNRRKWVRPSKDRQLIHPHPSSMSMTEPVCQQGSRSDYRACNKGKESSLVSFITEEQQGKYQESYK
jgi:hypothetical protein